MHAEVCVFQWAVGQRMYELPLLLLLLLLLFLAHARRGRVTSARHTPLRRLQPAVYTAVRAPCAPGLMCTGGCPPTSSYRPYGAAAGAAYRTQ